MVIICCLQPLKDVNELKKEIQEARRVKKLHFPNKVESLMLTAPDCS
jgi:hypothetical protein